MTQQLVVFFPGLVCSVLSTFFPDFILFLFLFVFNLIFSLLVFFFFLLFVCLFFEARCSSATQVFHKLAQSSCLSLQSSGIIDDY